MTKNEADVMAGEWIHTNVVLAEHCGVEYSDLVDSLSTLLERASQSTAVAVAKPKKADIDAAFDVFWQSGIRKMDKKVKARPAFTKAIPKGCPPMEFAEMLCRDVAKRLEIQQGGFANMHPSSYLNGERWEDEIRAPEGFAQVQDTGMFGAGGFQDCLEPPAAPVDDTLAFMRTITKPAEASTEVQGQLTLEHQG